MNAKPEYMMRAIKLARINLGKTSPSPSVGCVIVKNDIIIGEGVTDIGGRPHAEFVALEIAKNNAKDSDIYVTLEPCAHQSHRGPTCANIVALARPKRVIIAHEDPDPRTAGNGIAILKANNIECLIGLGRNEALNINAGFINWLNTKKPIICLSNDDTSFDAPLSLLSGENLETALLRHGELGHTRVYVRPNSALHKIVFKAGLLFNSSTK